MLQLWLAGAPAAERRSGALQLRWLGLPSCAKALEGAVACLPTQACTVRKLQLRQEVIANCRALQAITGA